jgi:hypothetical protein
MSKAQRFVVMIYCLLLAYGCLWVPWHVYDGTNYLRTGYGWLWVGPSAPGVASYSTPDLVIMGFRFMAATAISAAIFLLTGIFTRVSH